MIVVFVTSHESTHAIAQSYHHNERRELQLEYHLEASYDKARGINNKFMHDGSYLYIYAY